MKTQEMQGRVGNVNPVDMLRVIEQFCDYSQIDINVESAFEGFWNEYLFDHDAPLPDQDFLMIGVTNTVECSVCSKTFVEQDKAVDACPHCGNADKTKTIYLVPNEEEA